MQALHEGDQYQASTLLFAAARLGCEAEARVLLDRGAAIDAKDREGKTALAKAAEANKLPLMRLLLERGADANARAVDGSTPLLYAAEQDRGPAVALLLERGADPNFRAGRACVRSPPPPTMVRRTASRRCSNTAPIRMRSTMQGRARSFTPLATATPRLSRSCFKLAST